MKKSEKKVSIFFKNNWLIILLCLIALVSLITAILIYNFKPYKASKDFSKIDLSNANKLMLVTPLPIVTFLKF